MPEHRQYRKPPIQEALCEIRFSPGPAWNLTIPGRFYESVKRSYPEPPKERVNLQLAGMEVEHDPNRLPGAPRSSPALTMSQSEVRVQFSADENRRQVAVGPDVLSVHDLHPYSGWHQVRPRIEQALQTYRQIAEPIGVKRIGLRYINLITLPGGNLNLDDYFVPLIGIPAALPIDMTGFLARVESVYENRRIRLLLTFGSAKADPGFSGFILDLDTIYQEAADNLELDNVMSVVDDLHEREHEAFEALITEKTREVLDAE
jgi:uncharacterized protein (TIGR04255 family)